MEQYINEVNILENLKATYTVPLPVSIREKVAAWAFEDADDADAVLANLERIDCAGCSSPAPFYFDDMAREIGEHWPEIDAALDNYREDIGEAWTPKKDQNFLTFLWFAYESIAYDLANEIRSDLETNREGN